MGNIGETLRRVLPGHHGKGAEGSLVLDAESSEDIFSSQELAIREVNEILPEDYLDSLSEPDRRQVTGVIDSIDQNMSKVGNLEVGIIAVGSTVYPEEERGKDPVTGSSAPNDIDLRIVTSAEPDSEMQKVVVDALISVVADHLQDAGYSYLFTSYTHAGKAETVDFSPRWGAKKGSIEGFYFPEDATFEVAPSKEDELPLHIILSSPGTGSEDLAMHIRYEREDENYYSVIARLPRKSA